MAIHGFQIAIKVPSWQLMQIQLLLMAINCVESPLIAIRLPFIAIKLLLNTFILETLQNIGSWTSHHVGDFYRRPEMYCDGVQGGARGRPPPSHP